MRGLVLRIAARFWGFGVVFGGLLFYFGVRFSFLVVVFVREDGCFLYGWVN